LGGVFFSRGNPSGVDTVQDLDTRPEHVIIAPGGEIALLKDFGKQGVIGVKSTLSCRSIEPVVRDLVFLNGILFGFNLSLGFTNGKIKGCIQVFVLPGFSLMEFVFELTSPGKEKNDTGNTRKIQDVFVDLGLGSVEGIQAVRHLSVNWFQK
jgi:hypothetical protein